MTHNVLFLCTGNSARSILAEAILGRVGAPYWRGWSAGSQPKGAVNPHARELLTRLGYDVTQFRSKPWDEFAAASAPRLDIVITVCDSAAGEVCPVWPGRPATAHWGMPDPAAVDGTPDEIAQAFAQTYSVLEARIRSLTRLDLAGLDPAALKQRLAEL